MELKLTIENGRYVLKEVQTNVIDIAKARQDAQQRKRKQRQPRKVDN